MCVRGLCVIGHLCVVLGYACLVSHVGLGRVYKTCGLHVASQAAWFMGFSRQKYWSGLLCLPSGDLPNPGIKPRSPALQADSLPSEPPGKPRWNHEV